MRKNPPLRNPTICNQRFPPATIYSYRFQFRNIIYDISSVIYPVFWVKKYSFYIKWIWDQQFCTTSCNCIFLQISIPGPGVCRQSAVLTLMDPKIGTQIGRNWKDSFKDKEGHHHLLRYSLQGKHCYNLKPVCIKLAQPWLVTFPGQLFFSGKKAQPGPISVRAFPKMQARCICARYTWPKAFEYIK